MIGQVSDPTPFGYHMVELNPQAPISKGPGGWEKENLPPISTEFQILPLSLLLEMIYFPTKFVLLVKR